MKFTPLLLLAIHFVLGPATWGQSSREVMVRITVPGEKVALVDTSFFIEQDVDIDSVLALLNTGRWDEGEPLDKLIVIREPEQRADVARSRPQHHGPKPMLGLYLDTNREERDGVKLTGVFGSAEKAGLREGDLIIGIDGEHVYDVEDIGYAKEDRSIGDVLQVKIKRDEEEQIVPVTLSGEQALSRTYQREEPQQTKGFMGVYTDEVDRDMAERLNLDSQLGVYLKQVVPGSGADEAGLQSGDIITHVEGRELDAAWELSDALSEFGPGNRVLVGYLRDGEPNISQVTLTKRIHHKPKPARWKQVKVEAAYLGVFLDSDGQGVRITRLAEEGAAEAAGLQQDDRILSVDREEVDEYDQLAEIIQGHSPGDKIRLRILRDGSKMTFRPVLGSRISHRWVMISPELDRETEEVFEDMEDPAQADDLREQMTQPTLDMEDFEFFPNPNSGQFRLRFNLPDMGNTDIRVFSPEGKEVYRERLRNFSGTFDQRIDLGQELPRGVYFLQITRNGRGMVERLIIQ